MYIVVLTADTPSPRLQEIITISSEVNYQVCAIESLYIAVKYLMMLG